MIEVDVTSYTDVDDYWPYQIPEVWLFKQQLLIYRLQDDRYSLESGSRYFPEFNVAELVLECLQLAHDRNTSTALRELQRKLSQQN